jgi:hypothetical protein
MKILDRLGDIVTAATDRLSTKKDETQADLIKAKALADLAAQPAKGINPWLIIIPAVILVAGGITAYILLRKKK